MKKPFALLLLSAFLFSITACTVESDPVTPQREAEIQEAIYRNKYAHRVEVFPISSQEIEITVYGWFRDVGVFFWNGISSEPELKPFDYNTVILTENLCGREFRYTTLETLQVYANETFYSLSQGYEEGILTNSQIRLIYNRYKETNPHLYAMPLTEDTLTGDEFQQVNTLFKKYFSHGISGADHYLGTFGENRVFRCASVLQDAWSESIGRETFSKHYTYWVCTSNTVLSLSEAYDEGRITDEDLQVIARRNAYGWETN